MAITKKSGFTLVLVVGVMIFVEAYRGGVRDSLPAVEQPVPVTGNSLAEATPIEMHQGAADPLSAIILEELPLEGILDMPESKESLPPALPPEDAAHLEAAGWTGDGLIAWVCVERQRFYVLDGMTPVMELPCATAAAGTGALEDSLQTPLGWHEIAKKIGEDAPWGRVFRARAESEEIWKPGTRAGEDLVLTRLLWLAGLEAGKNKGVDARGRMVDSMKRFIYIHGTNEEERLGTPSSHGCIRLRNDDVIEVFDRLPEGTRVFISDRAKHAS